MKLIYCIPSLYNPGGMERVITEKVNYLVTLPKYEITIVTTDQQDKTIRFSLDTRIHLVHLDINFSAHYSDNLFKKYVLHKKKLEDYKRKLTQLINELNADICISLCGKEIDFLYKLPVKCKKIAEIHFGINFRKQFMISRHNGFLWKFLGEIRTKQLKQSVKKLDKLVVLTKDDKYQWERTHRNVTLINNPNPLQNDTIACLDSKNVLSIGKLDPQKGFDMLIETWKLVAIKHPDWSLNIFGIGEWEQMLNNRIKELNLTGKINLLGLTSDVMSNYLNSSIYVMSSRYEGLPMVLIEAMSCGLPVVSFDCEYGPREIIVDGMNGFLVEQDNIHQLADKISVLIENETLRKQMGLTAHKTVQRFSKDTIMLQWTKLFESMVK